MSTPAWHPIPVRGSPLEGLLAREHANLDAATAAIARHLNGTCQKETA